MRPRRWPQPQMTLSAAPRELPANAECDSTCCLRAPGCTVALLPAGVARAAPGPINFRYLLLLARDGVGIAAPCPSGDGASGGSVARSKSSPSGDQWPPGGLA
jgi:hypothetical protein